MADVVMGKEKCGEQRLVSLPLSRIRVIMKSSPEVSSINQEALVLTAKATARPSCSHPGPGFCCRVSLNFPSSLFPRPASSVDGVRRGTLCSVSRHLFLQTWQWKRKESTHLQ
ncbi:chromatin accessibility complex protein 1 isoform X3 [Physeter macrocephalus]|uniref:Chromatin accessibility complex protein 1 isoform X3 n=1 Tax=Physeter macrocephalus TaxID=9755 RepID=A0A455C586_PHYMC|nr:chromatin accessibility complex protein 1 isoform X3 [Physeter catodon]|eukprot:XP_028356485.1 chromatin accessibility complex protein 1 isoform X2 [Physeter catodon]